MTQNSIWKIRDTWYFWISHDIMGVMIIMEVGCVAV